MNYYTFLYSVVLIFVLYKNDMLSKILSLNNKKDLIRNLNIKFLIKSFLVSYIFYSISFSLKIILLVSSLLIYLNYNKINFILNQLLNIYNNKFLINKFLLL